MQLLIHKHTRGKITEEKSEIAVASRMNGQERARCIECEITEAILEVTEENDQDRGEHEDSQEGREDDEERDSRRI
jgi:hypothetical protein